MDKQRIKLNEPRTVFGYRLDAGSVIELPASTAEDLMEKGIASKTKSKVSLLINGDAFVIEDGSLKPVPVATKKAAAKEAQEQDAGNAEAEG